MYGELQAIEERYSSAATADVLAFVAKRLHVVAVGKLHQAVEILR